MAATEILSSISSLNFAEHLKISSGKFNWKAEEHTFYKKVFVTLPIFSEQFFVEINSLLIMSSHEMNAGEAQLIFEGVL